MERRVTAVELRPINLLPASAIPDENDDLDPGPDTVVGLDAPNQYKKVVGGYYYSSQITGVSKPRIELYFEADPGLDDDLTVRVSGIHNIRHSGDNVSIAGSGDFKTINSDRPPYENRAVYSGQRDTPDADTVAATVLYNPGSGTQYGLKKEVVYRARISTLEATTTTAKIVFTSTNPFEVGDVIYVDVRPDDGPFFGLDGLHKVASVGSNFITYSFSSSLEEPINVASVTDEVYVHAVAQSAIRDGATWISPTNVVYVWKDIRWVLFSSSSPITEDGVAPEAVTNLAATDENDTPDGSSNGLSRVTLTWDAPTLNTDGTTLDDLVGYTVWSRQLAQGEWEKYDFTGSETTWSKGGFQQGKRAYFKVFARDSGGNLSDAANLEYVTSVSVPTVSKPAAPAATTYLGTIKIAYDDLTANGLVQANTAKEIQVYFSDIDGFTPGPDSYYGKFPANAGSYIIIPGTEIEDNTDYYIKIVVRDIYGNITDPSDQVSIRARKSEIVTFDMIDVGSLTAQAIVGLQISTSENASVDGGIVLTKDFLAAYDQGGNQTFRIDADDGSVSIGAYLGRDEADGFLTIANADLTYTTKIASDSIKLTAETAKSTAESAAQTADDADEKINDITEITAGGLRIRKAKTIQSLNIGSVDLSNNTTKIDGGVIQTGTILANQIGAGNLPVGVIYAGTINADKVSAGTLVGSSVRTNALDGQRVSMSAATNSFRVFNSSGTEVGYVDGGAVSGIGMRLAATSGENIRLSSGFVFIYGDTNEGLFVGSPSTGNSSRVEITTSRFIVRSLASGGYSVVQSTSAGLLTDISVRGTGNAMIYAGSDGLLTRNSSLSGTGIRNVSAGSTGLLVISGSDRRLKQNIEPLLLGLDLIDKLNPQKFEFKSDPGVVEYGLIAQDVRESLRQLNVEDNVNLVFEDTSESNMSQLPEGETDPVLGIEYIKLIPVLINSIKELKSRIETLESEREISN
jgi:hypothetical protein